MTPIARIISDGTNVWQTMLGKDIAAATNVSQHVAGCGTSKDWMPSDKAGEKAGGRAGVTPKVKMCTKSSFFAHQSWGDQFVAVCISEYSRFVTYYLRTDT